MKCIRDDVMWDKYIVVYFGNSCDKCPDIASYSLRVKMDNLHNVGCVLFSSTVSQTALTSDVPTDPICPDTPVVFTCTVDDSALLRWLVANSTDDALIIQYTGETPSSAMPLPGIEPELISAQDAGGGLFDYHSTLNVSAASVLGAINTIICNGGSLASEVRRTVELRCESE